MISAWYQDKTSTEDQEQFKREVLGSKQVLKRLSQILDDIESEQDSIEANPSLYDLPNWDYRQAHLNGYRQCLRKINKIINLDQQDK